MRSLFPGMFKNEELLAPAASDRPSALRLRSRPGREREEGFGNIVDEATGNKIT